MAQDGVDADALGNDPIEVFRDWLADAQAAGIVEPFAMALATAGVQGPDVRFVLLRGVDARGFVFYTNRESAKGRQIAADPRATLAFYWDRLGRQVRVTGQAEQVDRSESEAYWRDRPRGHRLAAWASPQSDVVGSRTEVEQAFEEVTARFPTDDVPLPPFWGGYRIVPEAVEFWVSREDRLHDRIRYRRSDDGWIRERLAP